VPVNCLLDHSSLALSKVKALRRYYHKDSFETNVNVGLAAAPKNRMEG